MSKRLRLDALLVERGLAASREQARARILAGQVRVGGQRADKPGTQVLPDAAVELSDPGPAYVSRGGVKLDSAHEAFGFPIEGRICMDVGASTGGFTDFLLKHGAAKVYAIDVGYGQLAWALRSDPRVVVLERVNARQISVELVPDEIDLAVIDVSFISLEKVVPAVAGRLAGGGEIVALVKPQFEAGPGKVGKKGVVRDPDVHREVLERNVNAAPGWGLGVLGATYSKLQGPEGNIEFFLWMRKGEAGRDVDAGAVVARAHEFFVNSRAGRSDRSRGGAGP